MERVHTFARQFLRRQRKTIINPETEKIILPRYEGNRPISFARNIPFILASPSDDERRMIITEINYADLKRMGLIIFSIPIKSKRWFKQQKTIYFIDFEDSYHYRSHKLDEIISKAKIQHDRTYNKVRLMHRNAAPNGRGKWVSIRRNDG